MVVYVFIMIISVSYYDHDETLVYFVSHQHVISGGAAVYIKARGAREAS